LATSHQNVSLWRFRDFRWAACEGDHRLVTEDERHGEEQDGAAQQRQINDEVRETQARLAQWDAEREADLSRRERAADQRDTTANAREAIANAREATADAREERQAARASSLDEQARLISIREADLDQAQHDQREIDQELRSSQARQRPWPTRSRSDCLPLVGAPGTACVRL
jgi:hypothetical protein